MPVPESGMLRDYSIAAWKRRMASERASDEESFNRVVAPVLECLAEIGAQLRRIADRLDGVK